MFGVLRCIFYFLFLKIENNNKFYIKYKNQ